MTRTLEPGRGPLFQSILLLSVLGLGALLQPAAGTKVREITIVLTPRNYTHPRDRPGFFCGLESKIDNKRLLAELNSNYLLNLLDNTKDPSPGYPTSVFQVASFDAKGDLYRFPRPCIGGCLGVFSLVLIPPSRECYGNLFSDASVIGEDYYVVFLGQSIPEEAITKFQGEAENLKALYDGEMPKLCGTRTFMRSKVAKSFTESLTSIFNFHLNNPTRTIGDPSLRCMHSNETENSLAYSSFFEYSSTNFQFETNTVTAIEEEGFMETKINRQSTGKAGVAFIETTLEAQAGGPVANRSDIVPFNGPVYFKQGNNTASFYTQIKIDNQPESDEAFTQSLKSIVKGRAKRMVAPVMSGKIGDQDVTMVANDDVVKVMTIPVGQGDSTMIECPNGWITMIDMGSMEQIVEKGTFSEHVLNYLKTTKINGQKRTIRHIFLTHPDADHINYGHWKTTTKTKTKTKTMTKPKTKTKTVIKKNQKTNTQKTKTKTETTTTHAGLLTKITSADGRKFKVHIGNEDNWSKKLSAEELLKYVRESKHFDIVSHQAPFTHVPLCQDDSNLEVYMEIIASDLGMSANSQSMVMKLHAYGKTMLFLGDIEDDTADNLKKGEPKALTELIQKRGNELASDVVMIPHHGSSDNGNGETQFYKQVKARYAVISSHIDSKHDHPRQKTMDAYCQKVVYGTIKYMDACDIPCGFDYKYPKDPTAKASWEAICPDGKITSWGPMKTLNRDWTTKSTKDSRRTMYESYNCPGGEIYQTTKFRQRDGDNELTLMARMVVTDLRNNGITMKAVELNLKDDKKGTVRYVPQELNENMFQKAYDA